MICPKCGRENIDDQLFCSYCGIKFSEYVTKEESNKADSEYICFVCGTKITGAKKFCYCCGAPVKNAQPEVNSDNGNNEMHKEPKQYAYNEPQNDNRMYADKSRLMNDKEQDIEDKWQRETDRSNVYSNADTSEKEGKSWPYIVAGIVGALIIVGVFVVAQNLKANIGKKDSTETVKNEYTTEYQDDNTGSNEVDNTEAGGDEALSTTEGTSFGTVEDDTMTEATTEENGKKDIPVEELPDYLEGHVSNEFLGILFQGMHNTFLLIDTVEMNPGVMEFYGGDKPNDEDQFNSIIAIIEVSDINDIEYTEGKQVGEFGSHLREFSYNDILNNMLCVFSEEDFDKYSSDRNQPRQLSNGYTSTNYGINDKSNDIYEIVNNAETIGSGKDEFYQPESAYIEDGTLHIKDGYGNEYTGYQLDDGKYRINIKTDYEW